MSRIATNLSGIERALLNRLAEANAAAAVSTLRLATMKKINHPSDDPPGFVTLSQFQTQLSNVTAAMTNVTAASSIVTQSQTALGQIQTQLSTIRSELLKAESQDKIDTAITQINTLAGTTIDGRHPLDGSADFQVSGRNPSQVTGLTVYSTAGASQTISGTVTQAATQGSLDYTGSGGKTTSAATFTLTGYLGSESISVDNLEDLSSVATKINNKSHQTGVTASVDGDQLTLSSVYYGSAGTVTVAVTTGTFIVAAGNSVTDSGVDATAEINGQTYTGVTTSDGNRITVNQNGFHYEIRFAAAFTGQFDTMTVSGDALSFVLSTSPNRRATLAIPGLQAARLGGLSGTLDQIFSGGAYSGFGDNTSHAIRIVDEAINDVTRIKGNVDGFYNAAISSASGLLSDVQSNLEDTIDALDLVDSTEENQKLTFYQGLADNAVSGLTILNQQRSSIVEMIKAIAGLT